VDVLLVGQGLAGSLLAYELIGRGVRVMVVDDGADNASKVAAGLINPVTGRHLVKSAEVDVLLPIAKRCYQALAERFGLAFYIEKPMLRLLRNEAEVKQAERRLPAAGYRTYLSNLQPASPTDGFAAPFGYLEQRQTGYLLTKPLLACLKTFLQAQDSYRQARFDHQALTLAPKPQWQDIAAQRVVFCEGHRARHNPWFSWLPFQAVKGEILCLQRATGSWQQRILNYGHWLVPLSETQSRTGATFDRHRLDCQPTAAARTRLLGSLAKVSPNLADATVIGHQAGIRPSTLDKQPFTGFHPQYPQLGIFNGFGAKGGLQIPGYSQRFAESLVGLALPPSAIDRHYAAHFPG